MYSNLISILLLFSSFIFSQCDGLSNIECNNNQNCDWMSDVVNMNCSSLGNQTSCENYSDYGCEWTWSWGGWMNSGSSCTGGTFQIDYGYCEDSLYQLGDINQDSIVNVQDIIILVSTILNAQSNDSGDLNSDGVVNILDVVQIVNIILSS